MSRIPRVVIAGLRGGSGKTTLSVGLLRAFKTGGLTPAAFKKGPDYIDAGWLSVASDRACYNLDPFLVGKENILDSFIAHQAGADVSVVEGNRGLFDGMDLEGSQSTARLARLLKAPVILVLDSTKMTRTAAALVLGVKGFEPKLLLSGVVLNQVAGARHQSILRASIERYTGVPVLGAIPRVGPGWFSERHMGLVPHQEHPAIEQAIGVAEKLIKESVDVERILETARLAPALRPKNPPKEAARRADVTIGIVRDSAFQFYYPENIEAMEKLGAQVVEVSPLSHSALPPMDALYIGGGFPETHAIALSKNKAFLKDLKKRIEGGLPVYAECGGLMYLGTYLQLQATRYPMAGVFPYGFVLENRPVAHGYSVAQVTGKNPYYPKGAILQGHEFHYSRPVKGNSEGGATFTLRMTRGNGIEDGMDGLCYKNAFATYTHIHALGTPHWAKGMIKAALAFKKESRR